MSKYTFTFKKDDIFVEFVTTDKDVVEQQFQIWVMAASDYIKNRPGKIKKNPEIKSETEHEVDKKIEEKLYVEQEAVIESSNVDEPREEFQQEIVPEVSQVANSQEEVVSQGSEIEEIKAIDEFIEEKAEVFDNASDLLKTINTIQNPPVEEKSTEANFESVLDKSIESSTFEPSRVKDDRFINLIKAKKTTDSFHYLIITAYYLSEIEKLERFSLKQINAKLMYNLSEVIDHAVLQEALNQNLIELVPDLTGVSDISEYKLTDMGESFFVNRI